MFPQKAKKVSDTGLLHWQSLCLEGPSGRSLPDSAPFLIQLWATGHLIQQPPPTHMPCKMAPGPPLSPSPSSPVLKTTRRSADWHTGLGSVSSSEPLALWVGEGLCFVRCCVLSTWEVLEGHLLKNEWVSQWVDHRVSVRDGCYQAEKEAGKPAQKWSCRGPCKTGKT